MIDWNSKHRILCGIRVMLIVACLTDVRLQLRQPLSIVLALQSNTVYVVIIAAI